MRILILALALLAPPHAEPERVGFDVLAGFEYTEGMQLPAEVTKLDGLKVTVSGFMRREDDRSGETEFFMLINDACGCQGTPKMNEIVFCAMPEKQPTDIHPGIVSITGTLSVGEQKEDEAVVALYALDVDTISQQ